MKQHSGSYFESDGTPASVIARHDYFFWDLCDAWSNAIHIQADQGSAGMPDQPDIHTPISEDLDQFCNVMLRVGHRQPISCTQLLM